MQSTGATCVTATLWCALSLPMEDLMCTVGIEVPKTNKKDSEVMQQHLFATSWLYDAPTLHT